MKIQWKNLKDMRCPQCGGIISHDDVTAMFSCRRCDFKIGKEKFESIISSIYSKGKYEEPTFEKNLSELNNL